jgi:Tfp pilus assembly protein PilZ
VTADARQHPRYALEIDVEIRTANGPVPARSRDVSRGGLCCITKAALPLGTDVHLNMSLVFDEKTFSEPLLVRARIVWCTGLGDDRFQLGTTFVGLTQENRAYLEMFLRYIKEGQSRLADADKGTGDKGDDDGGFFG